MPYRERDREERRAPEDQGGIVGDLIRQFADPYALFRELVQNAIDASSPDIRVDLARDPDGALLISVSDRGEGMDRETLETKLLVLFRSGKEGVAGKIGKFGIGFVSVLAIEPSVVKVRSVRGQQGHTLHLYADHSYELFEHGGTEAGTTVTLVVPVPAQNAEARLAEHVQRARQALTRWCEHAELPITLHVDTSVGGDGRGERIDRPMQLDDSLCVATSDARSGETTVLVGLSGHAGQRTCFYNRGLLLAETEEDLGFPGLSLKVQDARLEHTLSRDNVRRDEQFERVLALARDVAQVTLRKRVHEALRAASAERTAYFALAEAFALTALNPLGSALPLMHPLSGAAGSEHRPAQPELSQGVVLVTEPTTLRGAQAPSPLTALLARRGEPVVNLAALPAPFVARLNAARVFIEYAWVDDFSAVELRTPAPGSSDAALLEGVTRALSDVYRDPRAVLLGVIHGAHAAHVAIGQPDDAGRPTEPFALLPFLRAPLVLNVEHPLVRSAQRHATTSVAFAADMLARAVLAEHHALSAARSADLLDTTLDTLMSTPRAALGSDSRNQTLKEHA